MNRKKIDFNESRSLITHETESSSALDWLKVWNVDNIYFDDERKFGYGGYKYDGRWQVIVSSLIQDFNLSKSSSLLDLGCAKGFLVNDFNNDDIIYISGRQARIVRVGIRNTVFYMSDRRSKMLVPNEQLKHLTIEKALPKNGGQPYLPKASDPGFVGWEEVPLPPAPTQIEVIEKADKLKRPRK